MAEVRLTELRKFYRQGAATVHALDGVDLVIPAGQFVSVVGRSGSGKTTLLDLCGLLLRPTSGGVTLDGIDTTALRDGARADLRGRKVGFIFQEYNLLPTLNVLENVMLPLRYAKPNDPQPRSRALDLVELVGLKDRIRHRPDELSGGEQQRVAIARALVNRPSLVLADEPTGAVDTQTAAELIALMRKLNAEEGVTFIVVTHDTDLASQTQRIIHLKDGRITGEEVPRPAAPAEVPADRDGAVPAGPRPA